ncbi:MAG: hypothetical protein AAF960_03455 [Bacteroidota bacterium]
MKSILIALVATFITMPNIHAQIPADFTVDASGRLPKVTFVKGKKPKKGSEIQIDVAATKAVIIKVAETIYSSELTVGQNIQMKVDAIRQINPRSGNLRQFIEETKKRLMNYYDQQCTTLIEKAKALAQMKQFREAFALLANIPNDADCCCHHTARNTMIQAYELYQDQNCATWLQKAKALYANNQFAAALRTATRIDPRSSCAIETEDLIIRIGKEVDAKERLELDLW